MERHRLGLVDGMENSPGVGEDLCVWSFQSPPPPPSAKREYPEADRVQFDYLAKIAHERLQALVGDATGGTFVFGAVTVGSRAFAPLCEANVSRDVFCGNDNLPKPELLETDIDWPQAITIFKVRPSVSAEDAKAALRDSEWRSSEDGHLPHIQWVIQGSEVPGWGSDGQLLAKVIVCKDIDPMFMYPEPFARESSKNGKTWAQLAFEEWNKHCGVGPFNRGDCTYAAPPRPRTGDTTSMGVLNASPAASSLPLYLLFAATTAMALAHGATIRA
eukprot:3932354-Rhodomonas_salina.2